MKKKTYFMLLALLLLFGAARAYDETEINLVCDVTLPLGTEGLKATLVSYANDDEINIRHENPNYYIERAKQNPLTRESDSTTVVITGDNNDIVFKKDYITSQVSLQLNFLGILSGEYKLNLFWHGCWWRGDFNFKSHWPEGQAAYIDSTYYLLNKGYATVTEPCYYLPNGRTRSHRMYWNAFERDYPLHVVIPSELTYEGETYQVIRVDRGAFQHCHFLLSIKLPNTITFIGDCAFAKCDNLRQFKIPESVTETGFAVFSGCSRLSDIVIPEGITTLRNQMFNECTNLSAVTLPSSLTTIEYNAFGLCSSLPYIEIPDNVTNIEEEAFFRCNNLKEIKLPKNLKSIEYRTFYFCSSLASIVIPQRVRSIRAEAFVGCTSLVSVTLPESLTRIDDKAFADMPSSGHIYCDAKEPFTISENTFNYKCTLHVPYGCKDKYQKAANWKNFTKIEEMEAEEYDEPVYYGETGVAPAVSDDAASDGQFYDLQGRPADGTRKGLYIRNGKKVLVK